MWYNHMYVTSVFTYFVVYTSDIFIFHHHEQLKLKYSWIDGCNLITHQL